LYPYEEALRMSMSMEVKLKIPVLIMFLHITSSSPSLTLPRFSRSAVRCCSWPSLYFYVARRDLKSLTRLFEPLPNVFQERHGYYKFREFAWGYSTLCTLRHPTDTGVIIFVDLSQATCRPSRCIAKRIRRHQFPEPALHFPTLPD